MLSASATRGTECKPDALAWRPRVVQVDLGVGLATGSSGGRTMDDVDQREHVINGCLRENSVTQVEDVARRSPACASTR